MRVIFVSLALGQSHFFSGLAKVLNAKGIEVTVFNFHERSMPLFKAAGIEAFNIPGMSRGASQEMDEGELQKLIEGAGFQNINRFFLHEKFGTHIHSTQYWRNRLARYWSTIDSLSKQLVDRDSDELVMVQELGGFVSVLCCYMLARSHNIDNVFIEPSFFRGRVFFTRNSLAAPSVPASASESCRETVSEYIKESIRKKAIVIPSKDEIHYQSPGRKLTTKHNVRRLVEKAYEKYVLKEEEEFNHLGLYVKRTVRMAVNSQLLKAQYCKLSSVEKYVYYPLHVPADFALTVRSPEYLDQLNLLEYIARSVKTGYKVVFKEHPAQVGSVDYRQTRRVLDRNDNLVLLDPSTSNFDAIARASLIVTVNSKSGAEALALGRPCVVLGDSFYTASGLARHIGSLAELGVLLNSDWSESPPPEKVLEFFCQVWNSSSQGEVFNNSKENIETFGEGLLSYLSKSFEIEG